MEKLNSENWRNFLKVPKIEGSEKLIAQEFWTRKAKLRVECPFCKGSFAYCSIADHVLRKHSGNEKADMIKTMDKENNPEVKCECGMSVTKRYLKKHKETDRHKRAIEMN